MPTFIRNVEPTPSNNEWDTRHRAHLALLAAAEQDLEFKKFKVGGFERKNLTAEQLQKIHDRAIKGPSMTPEARLDLMQTRLNRINTMIGAESDTERQQNLQKRADKLSDRIDILKSGGDLGPGLKMGIRRRLYRKAS